MSLGRDYEVFIGKVVSVLVKKGNKNYEYFKVSIPSKVSRKLSLRKGDFVLIAMKKAEWYHLLDMRMNRNVWLILPESIKEELRKLGLAPEELEYNYRVKIEMSEEGPIAKYVLEEKHIIPSESKVTVEIRRGM